MADLRHQFQLADVLPAIQRTHHQNLFAIVGVEPKDHIAAVRGNHGGPIICACLASGRETHCVDQAEHQSDRCGSMSTR